MKTVATAVLAVLSASLIACGGGGEEPEILHCPKMFQAAWIDDGVQETLLTEPEQSHLDDDSLASIGFFQATVRNLEGDVYVGAWCQDE